MEIKKQDFDGLTKEAQDALIASGVKLVEEKGMSADEVSKLVAEALAPISKEVKEFAQVKSAPAKGMTIGDLIEKNIQKAVLSSAFNNEDVAADGLRVLQSDVSDNVMIPTFSNPIIDMITKIPVSQQTLILPAVTWESSKVARQVDSTTYQGVKKPEGKLAFEERTLTLGTIAGVLNVSNQLLEDKPAVARWAEYVIGRDIKRTVLNEMFNGTGTGGQMLGICQSSAIVTQTRDTANTIKEADIYNMYSKLWQDDIDPSNLVLAYHPTATAAIMAMRDRDKGVERGLITTVLGARTVPVTCLGALGEDFDCLLFDASKYVMGIKGNGNANVAMNAFLYWLYNVTSIRGEIRVAGTPFMNSTITEDGEEYGYFVGLDADATT